MNWTEEADRRKRRFLKLAQARKLCVESGDRMAVIALGDCMRRSRVRLQYAEKMAQQAGKSGQAWPGFVPTDGARFATSDNRPNTAGTSGE